MFGWFKRKSKHRLTPVEPDYTNLYFTDLRSDEELYKKTRKAARKFLKEAAEAPHVQMGDSDRNEVAARRLAMSLWDEEKNNIYKTIAGPLRGVVLVAFGKINFNHIAFRFIESVLID